MGDMGDDFRALRKIRQQKRRENLKYSVTLLQEVGINHRMPSSTHCVVEHNGKTIDFYPSTGLWIDRANKKTRRGVRKLLHYLNKIVHQ